MITIIKIGGNIIDEEKQLEDFLRNFSSIEGDKILVHGGGKLATELAAKLGIETRMIDGRRVTDSATLRIAVMTYAGWISKTITAGLAKENCAAIGLTGADAQLLLAEKRKAGTIDYGFAGDPIPESVNTRFILQLLQSGIVPVIAPVTHDGRGQLLNTNADTIAATIANALAKENDVQLIYCFEKNGVLSDTENPETVIRRINSAGMSEMAASGKINSGMLPKLQAAFDAKKAGVKRVLIGHAGLIHHHLLHSEHCTEIVL